MDAKWERLVRLVGEQRKDRTWLVSSPDVPLLYVPIASWDTDIEEAVLPVLREMLQRNNKDRIEVTLLDTFESERNPDVIPSSKHVIARMAA